MKRLLWFGSLVPSDVVSEFPEASEAANRFQAGLLQGLLHAGFDDATAITGLAIATVPLPRRLLVSTRRWEMNGVDIVAPGFLNLPPVKPLWVHSALRREGVSIGRGAEAVLAYNALPGSGSAAASTARALGIPFVCVVADHTTEAGSGPLRRAQRKWTEKVIRRSDGLVVLSGHTVSDLGLEMPWVKVDGGISNDWDQLPTVEPSPKTVVYAGTPTLAGGARLLLDAFGRMPDPGMRLRFLGRGGLEGEIRAAAARDPRISLEGFLPREQMQRVLVSATALVNPRLSAFNENRFNFPSKILDYLASGRPVVTTLAGDLDPEYRAVTTPVPIETPEALARVLEDVCARPEAELAALGAEGRRFVVRERRWSGQAERVYSLIEQVRAR